MDMSDNKADLLRSLAIDRGATEPSRAPRRRGLALFAGAAAIVAVVALAALAAPLLRGQDRAEQAPAQPSPPQQQQGGQQSAAADTSEPGKLAASGYVVARRKATLAAEITGKVVEVMIDEGMTVTAGEGGGRLGSGVAGKGLGLAEARGEEGGGAPRAVVARTLGGPPLRLW